MMSPKHSRREFTRRAFLAGALATGTLSAVATYLTPGGRAIPSVNLKFVTGADPTGARNLLVSMWNRANPRATVIVDEVVGSTADQRDAMINRVTSRNADILNLDIINIPYFRDQHYISPVQLEDVKEFLPKTLIASQLGDPRSTQYWAAPFNTDVGMLFERFRTDPIPPDDQVRLLSIVIDRLVEDQSRQFGGQLQPSSSSSNEAFVVNVLEHALSRVPKILNADNGMPSLALEEWQMAFEPLRSAINNGRITLCDTEETTRDRFRTQRLSYMRNWPVKYRELQQADDSDSKTLRIRVGPLPIGILGGQSLAIAENAPQADRAADFVRFLAAEPAQKILASYGLASTRIGAYEDPSLQAFIPHLKRIRGAVEDAHPRPINPKYSEFSGVVVTHVEKLLQEGVALSTEFINDIRKALGLN